MDGEVTIKVTQWYRIGDELIEAPDPRVHGLPREEQLTAAQLMDAILDIQRGKREEAVTANSCRREEADTASSCRRRFPVVEFFLLGLGKPASFVSS